MAVLVVEQGPNAGMQFALQQDATVLGRDPDCDIVLELRWVSRHHARVLRIGGVFYLDDLNSTNGTWVNDQPVHELRRLEDGDEVTMNSGAARVVVRFRESGRAGRDVAASVLDDLAPNAHVELGERVCVCQETAGNLEQACDRVRKSLATHRLVFHPFTDTSMIQEALLREDPAAIRILGDGFHRIIALDAAHGLDARGRFDLAGFYEYAFRRLESVFELQRVKGYHEQDLMQVLMDEEPSLVCMLNAHVAPSQERRRLRSLTQEKHHALVVYRQAGKPKMEQGNRSSDDNAIVEGDFEASPSVFRRVPSTMEVMNLSAENQQILRLLAQGYTEKEVAAKLQTTLNAVHSHVKHLYNRLGLTSRAQLIALYLRND